MFMEREIPAVVDKKFHNIQARRQDASRWLNLLKYVFVLITISSITQWLSLPLGNTFLWWAIDALILGLFYLLKPKKYSIPSINVWFVLMVVNVLYGFKMAEYYWDWKMMITNIFTFSLPLAAYVFYKPARLKIVLKAWISVIWIMFLVLAPFMESDAFGRLLIPFSFLAIFFPILDRKLKIFILLSVLITVIFGADSRSNVLKYLVCLLMGLLVRFRVVMRIMRKCFPVIRVISFALPLVFLVLAATGTFNIFNIGEGTNMVQEAPDEAAGALDDTRTELFVDEFVSAYQHNYILYGRSMARGYDSMFFTDDMDSATHGTQNHYGERYACEVNILNVFNYFGVIGVLLYFWIFWQATSKALFHSRNVYVRAIGLVVLFRWIFGWVEDFSRFDLNMMFLWIMIGICYSPKWRMMTNLQVRKWAQSI